ncbi:MAG: 23S rRNA (uracil(1939)-C(5))-methyltransferase RlmD, partial [Nanoarchaeota archaeon]
ICKHFGICGGCQLQDLSYEEQLELKKRNIEFFFKDLKNKPIDKIIPSPKEIYYRNRMDYVVGKEKIENKEKIIIGLKEKGKWWKVVDLEECFLMSKEADLIKNLFKEFVNQKKLSAWDLKEHKGLLRYLIIREGKFTNERMLIINTSNDYLNKGFKSNKKEKLSEEEKKEKEKIEQIFLEFYDLLKEQGIKIDSFIHGVNNTITDISFNFEVNVLKGKELIKEKLNSFYFLIGPNSFFQSNSYTADLMVEEVKQIIKEIKEEKETNNLIDLYCGEGTFSIPYYKYFNKILGIELNKESIKLYNKNLELNKIKEKEKFFLVASSVEKATKKEEIRKFFNKDSLLIVDPPRSGLNKRVIELIKKSNIENMIYISCNYKTQYRDIKMLGFELKKLMMVDQFPQTTHVETIALLDRKK